MAYLDTHLSTNDSRTVIAKLWGYEELICNAGQYCGKILWYNGKFRSSLHKHLVKDEVLMVTKGIVRLDVRQGDEGPFESTVLSELGQTAVHLEPGVWHRLTPYGEATVYEWSTTHSDDDVVRLEPSGLIAC